MLRNKTLRTVRYTTLSLCLGLAVAPIVLAQKSRPAIEIGVTYAPERGKISSASCGCFWLQGAGADGAIALYHGFGAAASFSGGYASNLTGGNTLSKVNYLLGPRYTFRVWGKHGEGQSGTLVYGEALFGGVHAFGTTFPSSGKPISSATSFAYAFGGGLDVPFAHGFGIRPIEAAYFHSALPNNASGTQDDLRLGFGFSYRFGQR